METVKVKELRKKYGIHDSRNEYTEEEILNLSQQKLYYIIPNKKEDTNDICIDYKQVFGYISSDKEACIFIKDKEITGDENYIPMKQIRLCEEIKDGVYRNRVDNTLYCLTEDLKFCLNYIKQCVEQEIKDQIKELEEQISTLKKANIIINTP